VPREPALGAVPAPPGQQSTVVVEPCPGRPTTLRCPGCSPPNRSTLARADQRAAAPTCRSRSCSSGAIAAAGVFGRPARAVTKWPSAGTASWPPLGRFHCPPTRTRGALGDDRLPACGPGGQLTLCRQRPEFLSYPLRRMGSWPVPPRSPETPMWRRWRGNGSTLRPRRSPGSSRRSARHWRRCWRCGRAQRGSRPVPRRRSGGCSPTRTAPSPRPTGWNGLPGCATATRRWPMRCCPVRCRWPGSTCSDGPPPTSANPGWPTPSTRSSASTATAGPRTGGRRSGSGSSGWMRNAPSVRSPATACR
jgi:hypothetical protein